MDLFASSLAPSRGTRFATRTFRLFANLRRQDTNMEHLWGNLFAGAGSDSALAVLLKYGATPQPHCLVVDWRAACPRDVLS